MTAILETSPETLPRDQSEGNRGRTVSVVIPTHGRPELVRRAAASALAQTVAPIEVVVVIDGHDNTTRTALDELGDRRIRIVETGRRVGAAEARNVGIRHASGEWIALLDDDDEWLPQKLELQLALGCRVATRYPIVACRIVARAARDFIWPTRLPADGQPLSEYLFVRRSPFQGEGVLQSTMLLAPRELFAMVPFTRGLPQHQDWDWVLRAAAVPEAEVMFVTEPLAVWHIEQTTGSLSDTPGWASSVQWIRSLRHLVTRRAYAGFLLTVVANKARQERQWRAIPILMREAQSSGSTQMDDWARFAAMWVLPRSLRRWIRGQVKGAERS